MLCTPDLFHWHSARTLFGIHLAHCIRIKTLIQIPLPQNHCNPKCELENKNETTPEPRFGGIPMVWICRISWQQSLRNVDGSDCVRWLNGRSVLLLSRFFSVCFLNYLTHHKRPGRTQLTGTTLQAERVVQRGRDEKDAWFFFVSVFAVPHCSYVMHVQTHRRRRNETCCGAKTG